MRNSLITFILLGTLLIAACSDDEPATPSKVMIRISNTSGFDYTDVYVSTGGGGEFNYGDVDSNETTDYHDFEYAFHYAYIELKIAGVEYKIQPIDFVGETELANGNYTYRVGARQEGGLSDKLTLDFVAD